MAQATRSVADYPRFHDTAPHAWEGKAPWQYPLHGIDVSKWQGEIDWGRVRASGVDFAFIKATEGGDLVDDRFAENWVAAMQRAFAREPELAFVGGRVLPVWESEPPAWLTNAHWAPLALLDYGAEPLKIEGRSPLGLLKFGSPVMLKISAKTSTVRSPRTRRP